MPEAGNPQSLNRYSYVLNNPLRYTDPTGHWVFEETPEDQFYIPFYNSPTGESMRVENDPCFGACTGPAPMDPQTQAIVETVAAVAWEPADWAITIAHWAKGDFHMLDLAGLLPGIPAAGIRAVRHVDDLANVAKRLPPAFRPGKWLTHFEKHGAEFGYKTSMEYLRGAQQLVEGGEDVLTHVRRNGDTLFYSKAKNEFAVLTGDGTIRTYFRPDEGIEYWYRQTGQ